MRIINFLHLFILTFPYLAGAQVSPVVINEVMADNASTQANEAGDFSDWIELYNLDWDPVDLSGWLLVKGSPTNADQFAFPANTLIYPNGYLTVWFDKDTNSAGFHTGFALSKGGDQVNLMSWDRSQIFDSVGFGAQISDMSIGRIPDGYGEWQLCFSSFEGPNQAHSLGSHYAISINEWSPTNWDWIANPNSNHGHDDWLELYNPGTDPVALGGLVLTTLLPPTYPNNIAISNLTFIEGGGFMRFWANKKKRPDPNELDFGLSHNNGETITLYEADRVNPITQVSFPGLSSIPWVSTNVSGTPPKTNYVFMVQGRLPDGDTNIILFPSSKATPGESNFLPLTNVVVNEILAHTDPPLQDAVEFFNPTTNPVDLSYFWLSNSKNDIKKFRIPPNTVIPPLGYKVFYEYQFNPDWMGTNRSFTFNSAEGDGCYLFSATNDAAGTLTGYRRGVDFDASENGVSFGRWTNSAGDVDFVAMSYVSLGTAVSNTSPSTSYYSNLFVSGLGAPNPIPKVGPIVISEIMYHPPDIVVGTNQVDNSLDEYIELYNRSTNLVRLHDTNTYADAYTNRWKIGGAVEYVLPYYRTMGPGEFMLLVNFDPGNPTNATQLAHFRQAYNIPASFTNIYGPYGHGKLQNSGGTIELYKPDPRQTKGQTNYVPQILVEKVKYNDKYPWPTNDANRVGPDGGGLSLQRIIPESYANDPTNWVAAAPTPGWCHVKFDAIARTDTTVVLSISNAWAGSSYSILYSSELSNVISQNSWAKLADLPPQGTTGTRSLTNTVSAGGKRFYRIVSPMR